MAVVNDYNADYPLEFLQLLQRNRLSLHIQFAPIVERVFGHQDGRHLASLADREEVAELPDFSISPEQWGNSAPPFDEWVKKDVVPLHSIVRLYPGQLDRRTTGRLLHGKDLWTCGSDGVQRRRILLRPFVFPEYKLGNIYQKTLVEMMYSDKQQAFGQMKQQSLPTQCRECEWLFACNGECPKNRFARTASDEPGLNYLCKGYHRFSVM